MEVLVGRCAMAEPAATARTVAVVKRIGIESGREGEWMESGEGGEERTLFSVCV